MLTAALFTTVERRKQLMSLRTDDWINKMWHVHAIEYYSDLKRKAIHAATPGHFAR